MTRAELAAWIGARYGAYLSAASRPATDAPGGLKEPMDDALLALGYLEANLATAAPTESVAVADLRAAGAYFTMVQVVRDLGVLFDLGTSSGGNYRLSQMRAAAEKDLAQAEAVMLSRGLPTTPETSDSGVAVWDLNFLTPTL